MESVPLSFLVQHQDLLLQNKELCDTCPLQTNYILHHQVGPFGMVTNIVTTTKTLSPSSTLLRTHMVIDNHISFPTATVMLSQQQLDLVRKTIASVPKPIHPPSLLPESSPTLWSWAFGYC